MCKAKGHLEGSFFCKKKRGSLTPRSPSPAGSAKSAKAAKSSSLEKAPSMPSLAPSSGSDTDASNPNSDSEVTEDELYKKDTARKILMCNKTGDHKNMMWFDWKDENNHTFSFKALPDTGCSTTVMAKNIALREKLSINKNHNIKLTNASGDRMNIAGITTTWVRTHYSANGRRNKKPIWKKIKAIISDALEDEILLGVEDMKSLKLIHKNFPCVINDDDSDSQCEKARKINENKDRFVDFPKIKQLMSKYKDVLNDDLASGRVMSGEMTIELKPGCTPVAVTGVRRPPRALRQASKECIERLQRMGIIEEVPIGESSDWLSHGHFRLKPGRSPPEARLVTDYEQLNRYTKRPVHGFSNAKEIRENISNESRFFAVFDCVLGFHQVKLSEEASKMTTFVISLGEGARRYRYTRACLGLCSSGDWFCAKSDEAFRHIDGCQKLVDDCLLEGKDENELFERIELLLEAARTHGITLSLKKMQIGRKVKFGGYVVQADDKSGLIEVTPDPKLLSTIRDFPEPKNVSELRSFLGMLQQLSDWAPDLSAHTLKLRTLLKKHSDWQFTPEIRREFIEAKRNLTRPQHLNPFDPSLPTELLTDASRLFGLGFILIQRRDDGTMSIIQCGSCSLLPSQRRWAVVELEALGVMYAVQKCQFYLKGLDRFDVVTDHRPLLGVFARHLHEVQNSRLHAIREKLQWYNFDLKWCPGKKHKVADAISRNPKFDPFKLEDDPTAHLHKVRKAYTTKDHRYARLDHKLVPLFKAAEDSNYQDIVEVIRRDVDPKKLPAEHPGRAFKEVWERISIIDDLPNPLLVLDDHRIIVPKGARKEILRKLHIPHMGVTKTRKTAGKRYFWPKMAKDIAQLVEACDPCRVYASGKPRKAMMKDVERYENLEPMTEVGADCFQVGGKHFLIVVDRYSSFPLYKEIRGERTDIVTKQMTKWFSVFGFPEIMRSDKGPCFRDEFGLWCKSEDIFHDYSSSYNAESNGLAEAGVARVKKLIKKVTLAGESLIVAMAEFRNSEMADGPSPAQMFYKRQVRGKLPELRRKINLTEDEGTREDRRQKYLSKRNGILKQTFSVGQTVWIQNMNTKRWDIPGTIQQVRSKRRSYYVDTESGVKLRNAMYLKPRLATEENVHENVEVGDESDDHEVSGAGDRGVSSRPAALTRRRSPRLRVKFNLP